MGVAPPPRSRGARLVVLADLGVAAREAHELDDLHRDRAEDHGAVPAIRCFVSVRTRSKSLREARRAGEKTTAPRRKNCERSVAILLL